MDVRIDPEVSMASVDGAEVRVLALHLGGIPRGAAVVLAGPDGLDEMAAVDVMNGLAQHGFESVLAAPSDDAAPAVLTHLLGLTADRGWAPEQTAVLGYGGGSRAALTAGTQETFGGVICVPRETGLLIDALRGARLRSPWLGLVGNGVSGEWAGELPAAREQASTTATEHVELVGYRGVEHCLSVSTEALAHAAAFDSWQRTVEWLNIHVAPRPTPFAQAWRERQHALSSTHN